MVSETTPMVVVKEPPTVALGQAALLEVLDAATVADVDDRIRQAAHSIDQALIKAELSTVIGAAPTGASLSG